MIEFAPSAHWSDQDIAVVLEAHRATHRFRCLVRGEAIDERYGTPADAKARMEAFQQHRAEIEDRLRAKIESGHVERNPSGTAPWQVVLTAADLR